MTVSDFPGGSAVKTPHFNYTGQEFDNLVRELRSHMSPSKAKKLKIKQRRGWLCT